jgi:DNA-binding response OmpR family regulator/predicted regulator of Ras-like GTPase activity (Roadblock/LC7/MglB family)
MSPKRVLVVDDEPNVVKTCKRILELEGFAVEGATDGASAIKLYRSEDFDLVVTDLKMPGTDGLKLLAAIREHNPRASVAILTAYGTKENVVEALQLGACEFLEKPIDAKTLVAAVRRILDSKGGAVVQGNLRSLGLPNIVQINCAERNEALLRIRQGGREGKVYFAEGDVVHAALGKKSGPEAVYEMLTWEEGEFELQMGATAPKRTIEGSWSGLLLEGARRMDEGSAGLTGVEFELEEVEADRDEVAENLAMALKEIKGVAGVVVMAHDGSVVAQELKGEPANKGSIAVLLLGVAGQLGKPLALGSFKWGSVELGKETMLLIERPDYFVGIVLGQRASAAKVAASAEGALH